MPERATGLRLSQYGMRVHAERGANCFVTATAAQAGRFGAVTVAACLAAGLGGCDKNSQLTEIIPMKIEITSPAFAEGKPIPTKYTGEDKDLSPPLAWKGVPEGTRSLALIADDPDAPVGTWVHWVLYDLPPATAQLPEGLDKSQYGLGGARQGTNDVRRLGYGGPMPPPGKPHRYFFKLYALDRVLDLPPGATKRELLKAMEGHVLAEGQLMGTYQRR